MNLFLTNLQNSKRIKELGVKCVYEYTHIREPDGSTWLSKTLPNTDDLLVSGYEYYPAYTLDQLYPVLQEIGKIKGWGNICKECDGGVQNVIWEYKTTDGKTSRYACGHDVTGCPDYISEYQYHYLHICELAPSDPEAAQEYLSKLLS